MAVEEVFVPDHRVQAPRDTVQSSGAPRAAPNLRHHVRALAVPSPLPVRVDRRGAAWGAVEHFAAAAAASTRVANALAGPVRLADQDYVASEFAEAAGRSRWRWR